MPIQNKRVVKIILEECERIDERCEGYRNTIKDTLASILELEHLHRIQGTNIQQRINDKISAAGHFLSISFQED